MSFTTIPMCQPLGPDLKTICDGLYSDMMEQVEPCEKLYYPNDENPTSCLMVMEKYFFRNNAFAALTMYVYARENRLCLDIIATGGGTGIFGIDIGANSDLGRIAVRKAVNYNFIEVQKN